MKPRQEKYYNYIVNDLINRSKINMIGDGFVEVTYWDDEVYTYRRDDFDVVRWCRSVNVVDNDFLNHTYGLNEPEHLMILNRYWDELSKIVLDSYFK